MRSTDPTGRAKLVSYAASIHYTGTSASSPCCPNNVFIDYLFCVTAAAKSIFCGLHFNGMELVDGINIASYWILAPGLG